MIFARAGRGSLTQLLTKTAAGLIHCRRADHNRQSARRPGRAEAPHRHDGTGWADRAGRDCPAEIPIGALSARRVWPVFGEAGARGRTARAGARGAGERPSGAAGNSIAGGRRSRRDRGRSAQAGAPPIAGTPAQRGSAPSRTVHLSWLRRCAAQDRRRGQRDPRLRAGPVQSRPAHSREAIVSGLRHRGGGAGARSRNCPRPRRGGALGSYRRVKVRRSFAALSSGRDLRSRRGEPGDLDPVGLGWRHGGGAAASGGCPRRRRPGQRHFACRRHAGAGSGARYRQDQDRPAVDLCPR